jgi:hypothetical protein
MEVKPLQKYVVLRKSHKTVHITLDNVIAACYIINSK